MSYFEYYKDILSNKNYQKLEKTLEKPFKKSLRVNTIKSTVKDFQKIAEANKWELEKIPWCEEGFFINRDDMSIPLGKMPQHHAGFFYIQEASSMLPVEIFSEINENDIILDLASAPGSKFTQIAAKATNAKYILANELSGARIKSLISNIKRIGITNSIVVQKDPETLARLLPNTFTKIMLDAPCSGDGMIRRDSKTLDRWDMKKVKFQAGIQKRLIEEAFKLLKPGGELVYSTCTLTKEEDEEVLEHLMSKYKSAKLTPITKSPLAKNEGFLKIWPYDFDTEGFFISKITKTEETAEDSYLNKNRKNQRSWEFLSKKKIQEIQKFFLENFDFEIHFNDNQVLIEKNGEAWIWPSESLNIIKSINPVYSGIKIGKFTIKGFVPGHTFASTYGSNFKKNIVIISKIEAKSYLEGKDIPKECDAGFKLIITESTILGLGKSNGNNIKNILPRTLVLR